MQNNDDGKSVTVASIESENPLQKIQEGGLSIFCNLPSEIWGVILLEKLKSSSTYKKLNSKLLLDLGENDMESSMECTATVLSLLLVFEKIKIQRRLFKNGILDPVLTVIALLHTKGPRNWEHAKKLAKEECIACLGSFLEYRGSAIYATLYSDNVNDWTIVKKPQQWDFSVCYRCSRIYKELWITKKDLDEWGIPSRFVLCKFQKTVWQEDGSFLIQPEEFFAMANDLELMEEMASDSEAYSSEEDGKMDLLESTKWEDLLYSIHCKANQTRISMKKEEAELRRNSKKLKL